MAVPGMKGHQGVWHNFRQGVQDYVDNRNKNRQFDYDVWKDDRDHKWDVMQNITENPDEKWAQLAEMVGNEPYSFRGKGVTEQLKDTAHNIGNKAKGFIGYVSDNANNLLNNQSNIDPNTDYENLLWNDKIKNVLAGSGADVDSLFANTDYNKRLRSMYDQMVNDPQKATAFQNRYNLNPDGIVGPNTIGQMHMLLSNDQSYKKQKGGNIDYLDGGYLKGNKVGDRGNYKLEDGEFVLNKNAVEGMNQMFGRGFLDHINDDMFPRFKNQGLQEGGSTLDKEKWKNFLNEYSEGILQNNYKGNSPYDIDLSGDVNIGDIVNLQAQLNDAGGNPYTPIQYGQDKTQPMYIRSEAAKGMEWKDVAPMYGYEKGGKVYTLDDHIKSQEYERNVRDNLKSKDLNNPKYANPYKKWSDLAHNLKSNINSETYDVQKEINGNMVTDKFSDFSSVTSPYSDIGFYTGMSEDLVTGDFEDFGQFTLDSGQLDEFGNPIHLPLLEPVKAQLNEYVNPYSRNITYKKPSAGYQKGGIIDSSQFAHMGMSDPQGSKGYYQSTGTDTLRSSDININQGYQSGGLIGEDQGRRVRHGSTSGGSYGGGMQRGGLIGLIKGGTTWSDEDHKENPMLGWSWADQAAIDKRSDHRIQQLHNLELEEIDREKNTRDYISKKNEAWLQKSRDARQYEDNVTEHFDDIIEEKSRRWYNPTTWFNPSEEKYMEMRDKYIDDYNKSHLMDYLQKTPSELYGPNVDFDNVQTTNYDANRLGLRLGFGEEMKTDAELLRVLNAYMINEASGENLDPSELYKTLGLGTE